MDIDCLASKIISIVEDETIIISAKGIAQHMLLSEGIVLSEAIDLLNKPGADKIIWKLISCQSDFMGPTPRSIGIDIVSESTASKIQSSLDVKHIKKAQEVATASTSIKVDRETPRIKTDLVYSHPSTIWIRFYSTRRNINIPNTALMEITNNVYELYCAKKTTTMFEILSILEKEYDSDLIFCSELPAFLHNPLLFYSNYIKFMWCYYRNRHVFDPTSFDDIRALTLFSTYGLMFLSTNNLSSMSSTTHGPMISCSGERPKVALGKFDTTKVYTNEGSRAMQSLNKPSDFGTQSNYVEIISEVEIDSSCLNRII